MSVVHTLYSHSKFELAHGTLAGCLALSGTCYAPPCVTHALSTRRWRAINTLSELGWSSFAAHFSANAARKYRLCAVFRANLGCA